MGRAKSIVMFVTLLLMALMISNGGNILTPISQRYDIPIGLFQWGFFVNALLYLYYGVANKKPRLHLTPIMVYFYTGVAWGTFMVGKITFVPVVFYTALSIYLFLDIEAPEISRIFNALFSRFFKRNKHRLSRRTLRG